MPECRECGRQHKDLETFDLRVISLGAGVQSTCMYLMAVEGDLPNPDMAIFADTQSEPLETMAHLKWLQDTFGHIIPIKIATRGSLRDDVIESTKPDGKHFANVPFWTIGIDGRETPGRRHCTREFKIDVVKKSVRETLGLQPGERAAGRFRVEEWIGISVDEASRAKPSRYSWVTSRWPLLYDMPMRRGDCLDWMADHGYPLPPKSACTFCPFRGLQEWRELRDTQPEAYADAVEIDHALRRNGPLRGMGDLSYVHRSLRPLEEIVADSDADEVQINLFENECEGMCGV